MIAGYTITHDILDANSQPTQTFAGVSLITSPRLTRFCIAIYSSMILARAL